MATLTVNGSQVGNSLQSLLTSTDIQPGDDVSYQLCKTIYAYHPLGGKIVDTPIELAMSQRRNISIPDCPEDRVREAFLREWDRLKVDDYISNTMRIARIYGASAIVYGAKDVKTDVLIDPKNFGSLDMYFNVLDPLNTAGSLVLNQDPNAPDFQKPTIVTAAGQKYHPSRTCVMMNEKPLYIEYTNSAFGYVGRSAYQRALYPLKSFVQSMITDDMVTRKAGVLVAKMKQAGSISDRLMAAAQAIKRNVVKEAETNNVININVDEAIESLNLMNTDTAMTTARTNIINNIAAATPMPAKLLNEESFAEGFGEGTEDAKAVVRFIEGLRRNMQPLFDYFDNIVQYRAWTPEFYATIQNDFPEYKDMSYETAFFKWKNAFATEWPSLLVEPESKLVEVEKVKLESIVAAVEALSQGVDPENQVKLKQWAADNFNESKHLFKIPLDLDYQAMLEYEPPMPPTQEEQTQPGAEA